MAQPGHRPRADHRAAMMFRRAVQLARRYLADEHHPQHKTPRHEVRKERRQHQ